MKKTITSQGFLFLKENPLYLIYPFLSAIGNLAAFYLFIYISESIYGVKVFSTATLESWFSLQFWNKINHIVIAVLLIYIFYTILIFFSAIAAREISFNLDGKPKNILNSLSLTIKRFFAIIKYSAIESINTLIGFVKLLEIKNHLISLKRKIRNK